MNAVPESCAPPHPALSPSGGEGIDMAPSPSRRERGVGWDPSLPSRGRGQGEGEPTTQNMRS